MLDWIRKAAQGVGNFIYNSTPVGGAIRSFQRVQRDPRLQQQIQQAQMQAQRAAQQAAQQVQRQIPKPPPVPRINLPKINLTQASKILNDLNPGYQAGKFVQQQAPKFQDFTRGAGVGLKFATNQRLNPDEQRLLNIASQNKTFKPVVDFTKWNNQIKDQQRQRMGDELNLYKKSPATFAAHTLFGPVSSLAHTYKSAANAGINLPKFDTTKGIEDASQALAKTRLRKVPGMGVVGDLVKATLNQGGRALDVAQTQENYSEGMKGGSELLSDIATLGSLFYTGGLARQIGQAPVKAIPGLVARNFPKMAASGSGQNLLTQVSQGKKLNELDLKEAATAGGLYGVLGSGIPIAGKAGGKILGKVLSKAQAGTANKVAQNLNAPITVKTWAEKGKLLQDGYTNVKVKFSSPTHSVDIKNNGVVTELAPKGIKGVKIDKATQEAVDAGALSPKLAQQGYKVTPDLEIISPQGKKLSIGEIQQLEQASALTKAEQKIAQGTETLDQAEDLTKKLGRQVYADSAPQPRSPIGRFDRKPINPELEQLKAYQAEQIQQLQRVRPNSPEARGIKNNYDAAQKRIDALEPQPIYETVPKGTFDEGVKTRGFSETLQQSAPTNPLNPLGSKQFIDDIPGYKPITNKATFTKATKDIETRGVDTVYDELLSKQTLDVVDNAKAQLLLNRFVETDDLTRATALAQKTASDATSAGQAIQVLSAYNKLTPGGAFRDLQSRVNKYNEANKNKPITISPEVQKELQKLTTKLQGLKEGTRDWQVTAALIEKTKADVMPVTTLTKVSALQNFALLMNPKTLIRNILGNGVLDVLEDTSRLTAAGLDKALNTLGLTKQRNVVVPSFSKNWLNKATGFKYGVEDVKLGISTKGTTSKFDLKPDTFKNPLLHKVEQALGVELSAFDRAFYEGRYNSSLDNITKAWKLKAPNKAAKEVAEAEALYATFQNNSKLAEGLSKTKRALNAGKDWGLGDLVLKYPKTPGNIVSVGMDYSPIGFAKGLKQFYDSVKQQSPVKQREAILNLSRGITGSGLILGGAFLAKQGIITGNPESDPDIRALKRDAGEAPFSFNLSALGRLLSGQSTEVRDGDITMNYDWLQPNAIQLSMGANMIINRKDATEGLNSTFETLAGGIETITNQPVLTGIQRFVSAMDSSRGGGLGKAFQQLAVNTPSSFVPSILNQVGQLTDSTMRNTYAPDFKQETLNKVIARIPGLRNTLQPRIDQYGRTVTANNLVGGNNAFNVFLNPAFIRKVNISPENRLVFDIFQRSGETQQAPRVAPEKITINGQQYAVTPEEYTKYQQYIGSKTQVAFSRLAQDPRFLALNDTDKALYMNRILTDINSAAKVELFGNQPKTLTSGAKEVLGGRDLGYETAEEKRARTARPKKVKIKKGRTARARKGRKLAIAKSKQPKLRSIRISAGKVPKISRTAKVKFRRYA